MLTLPYNIISGYFDSAEFGSVSRSPARVCAKFEIEYYLEDGLYTFVDGRDHRILRNHIQIAKPGQLRYSELPFKTMYLKFSAEGELAHLLSQAPDYFECSHSGKIRDMLGEVIRLNESHGDILLLHSRLLELISLVLYDSSIPTPRSGSNYGTISKAKRFMEANYDKPIRLDDVAASVNLSPIYFHGLFSSVVGCSPHGYILSLRRSAAKRLLWSSSVSLDTVAESCGFGTQQSLIKAFKKATGMTPGAYRKESHRNYLEN